MLFLCPNIGIPFQLLLAMLNLYLHSPDQKLHSKELIRQRVFSAENIFLSTK